MTGPSKIRVGMVGISPGAGWAGTSHVPALASLPEFELVATAPARARPQNEVVPHPAFRLAFGNYEELVLSSDIDLVVVTTRVPMHAPVAIAALAAGKHVYCEWPLGKTTGEAVRMADAARQSGRVHAVGLQASASPTLHYVADLIRQGWIGRPLSTSMLASSPTWGAISKEYLADRTNGATLLSIIGGHSLDALCRALGEFREVSATIATQRPQTLVEGGRPFVMSSPDQVVVQGVLASGAIASVHLRGGTARGEVFLWEIHGDEGDLIVTANNYVQYDEDGLMLKGGRGTNSKISPMPVPPDYRAQVVPPGRPGNLARMYAQMRESITIGRPMIPGFDDAVSRHRMLDSIEAAALSGVRQRIHGE